MTNEIPAPGASRPDPLSSIWRFFAAPQTLIVLLGLLALSLILTTLVPQIPPQAVSDPRAWLAVQSGLFGQRNGLMRALGLFDIHHALWFHLLLVLVALCLGVRLVEAAELAWLVSVSKRWQARAFAFWGRRAPQVQLAPLAPADDLYPRLQAFFVGHSYHWFDVPDTKAPNAVISRRELFLWAHPLAYGALLAALAGLFIVGNWGWQIKDWRPAPGDVQGVEHGAPYTLRLEAFDLQMDQEGRLLDYSSTVAWLENDRVVQQDTVRVGQPAELDGLVVRQVGYLPALKVRIWDADAQPLTLQTAGEDRAASSEVEILFPLSDAQPLVFVSGQDLFLAFSFVPLSSDGRPLVQVALLRNGGIERLPLGSLYKSGELTKEGLRIAVDLTYRPVLRVDYRPAMGFIVVGMALAVLALAVGWFAPSRLAWLALGQDTEGTTLQVLAPAGARGRRWLLILGEQLGETLLDDA